MRQTHVHTLSLWTLPLVGNTQYQIPKKSQEILFLEKQNKQHWRASCPQSCLVLVRFFLVPEWPYPVVVVCEIVQVQQNLMEYRDSIQHKLPSQPWPGDTSHRITRVIPPTWESWSKQWMLSWNLYFWLFLPARDHQEHTCGWTSWVYSLENTHCGEVWGVSLRGCWNRFIAGFRFVFIELGAFPRAACCWDRLKSMGW